MKLYKQVEIDITESDRFRIVLDYIKNCPETVEVLLSRTKERKMVHCPFPGECKRFPCNKLSCNADCLDNGNAYRMS